MVWLASPTTQRSVRVAQPELEQLLLERRHVLVLVDHEEPELRPHLLGDPRLRLDHPGGREQHVLEVDLTALVLDPLVGLLQRDHPVDAEPRRQRPGRRGAGVVVERQARDLAPLDLGGDIAQRRRVDADPQRLGGLAEQTALGIQDAGQAAADDLRPEMAELRERSGVERARRHPARAELPQPRAQLARRPRREGECEDAGRVVDAGRDAVGDSMRQGAGLAGAGTREDADRAEQGLGGLALLGIEPREQVGRSGHVRLIAPCSRRRLRRRTSPR